MLRRLLRSPFLSLSLLVALAISIASHAERAFTPARVAVIDSAVTGDETRPQVRLEFDAPMVDAAAVGRPLPAGAVTLDPAAPVKAHFETPRRLLVEPVAALPRLRAWRVRFGDGFASLDGRRVAADVTFRTGALALAVEPTPRVSADGAAVWPTRWTAELAEGALRTATRVTDAAGASVAFRWTGEGRGWTLALGAVPAGPVVVEVAGDLRSREGGDPLGAPVRREVAWSRDLALADVEADADGPTVYVDLAFSHPLATQDLAALVTASPAPKDLVVRAHDGGARLSGAFPVGSTVVVTAKAGLRTASGLRLAKDGRRVLRVPVPSPFLSIVPSGATLSTAAAPTLELAGRDVAEVVVELRRVPAGNVVALALAWRRPAALAVEPVVRRVPVVAPPHARWTRTLDLAELLGAPPRGAWHVRVFDAAETWRSDARLLQVTDLAPVVRARDGGLVVSVASLADGTAVAGARVAAFTSAAHAVVEGRTDAAGLFVARGLALVPAVVVVTAGDDLAWVDLDDHRVAPDPRQVEGRAAPGPVDAWLRADRGVVRPGETVRLDALLRTPTGLAVAEGQPVTFTLRGPDGRVVRRVSRRTPASGLVDADLVVPGAARTGTYAVSVATTADGRDLATTAVRVEPFVPDRIEAKMRVPDGERTLGEVVPVQVVVRLFDGAPAPGRTVRLRFDATPVDRPAAPGFVFGDGDDLPKVVHVDAGEATTGADGVAMLAVPLPAAGRGGAAMRIAFDAEVVDLSGRTVGANAVVDARPGLPRLGVAPPTGADVTADVVLAPAADRAATATLERLVVRGAWTPARHGGVAWTSSEVVETLGTRPLALVGGRASVRFPDPGDGRFRLRVVGEGCAPATVRFARVGGRCDVPSAAPDPARLGLAIVGTVAPRAPLVLDLAAPFAGRLLLTVEGPDALVARALDVEAGATRIELPLPDVEGPCVHATATLSRGAAEAGDGPVRLFAATGVAVVRPERRLTVRADVADTALPEQPLEVRLSTSAPADVRVHLVDAAILARTRHPDADPTAHFGAVRRLDTRGADAYVALLAGARYPTVAATGGDEGEADDLAPRLDGGAPIDVATVALASATVAVDGVATVRFDVPAFEGRLRLVVVAASRTGTGATARDVVVRGPVGLFVHAPLAVAPGDVFDVNVEARGDGVVTEVALDGLAQVEAGPPLRVRALDRVGVATVTVTARDAAGHRVVRTARVAVRPAAPFEIAHVVRTLAAGERLEGALPGRYVATTRRVHVTVGTGPSVAWLPALDRLRDYPYGCAEQTTSRAFPLLALAVLARDAHPDGGDASSVDLLAVDQAVERLLSLQTGDGGLASWPGQDTSWAYGSVYGAHFLLEARRFGRPVPTDRLDALLDRLDETLRAGRGGAYEAFVLALAGRPTGTWLEVLAERATTDEARARLASAYVRRGDVAAARALLAPTGPPSPVAPATARGPSRPPIDDLLAANVEPLSSARAAGLATRGTPGVLASPRRADAILLDALVEVDVGDPRVSGLVARLTSSLAAARTTQEDATVLLALVHHEAKVRGTAGPANGRLVVGGRDVAFHGGATLEAGPGAPWTWLVEADAPVTVVVRVEGVPTDAGDAPRAQGMTLTRRIVGGDGGFVRGRTYRVELEGTVPADGEELLVADVLPGGFEPVESVGGESTLHPSREEVRDDRVLFFRAAPLGATTFRHVYLVRAVTSGTFAVPAARAELLYDPTVFASGGAGTVVISR